MSQELGTAVLRLEVKTQEALQALEAFKGQVTSALKNTNSASIFQGIDKDARVAGEKAGKALADGVKKAAKELRFGSFQQALDFTPKNTIKGLEDYARALRNLRDKTDLGVAGTQKLTDRLGAVEAALRRARQTTAQATDEQRRFNEALDKVALSRFSAQAKAFAAGLREQARATAESTKQLQRLREQAEGAAKAVASIAAKGAVEALKVPVFGLPKETTNTIDRARAQIERLQKQAETASGRVARLSEGIAVLGAGGIAAKGIVDTLGGIGSTAGQTTKILSEVRDALAALPGPLKGLGGLDNVFANGAKSVGDWAAGVLNLQGDLSTLAAPLQAVTDALTAIAPEAALGFGAVAFGVAGLQDLIAKKFKPGIDGAREALKGMTDETQALLQALAAASEASKGIAALSDLRVAERAATERVQAAPAGSNDNIEASRELLEIQKRIRNEVQAQFYVDQQLLLSTKERAQVARQLRNAASASGPLALPSSEMLAARVGTGIQPQRLSTSSINAVSEQSVETLRRQVLEAQKLAAAQASAGATQVQLNAALEAALSVLRTTVNVVDEQAQGFKFQNEILEEQLEQQRKLRSEEQARSKEARENLRREADARRAAENERSRAIGALRSSPIDGRLPGGQLIPGSPAARAANRRRLTEATSNAIIGGAFPALFGQGIGASAGGLGGGLVGGIAGGQFGFGLSLLGTALGSQFDIALQKFQTLGDSLSDPVANLNALSEAGIISSKSLEKTVKALVDTGRSAEAAQLIQQDLANTYGDLGAAKELADQSDRLNRSFARLQVSFAALASGPLQRIVGVIEGAVQQKFLVNRVEQVRGALRPEQQAQLDSSLLSAFGNRPRGLFAGSRLTTSELSLLDSGVLRKAIEDFSTAPDNKKLLAEQQRLNQLKDISLRKTEQEALGNQRNVLELEKRRVLLERESKLAAAQDDPDGIRASQINFEADEKLLRIRTQLSQIDKERFVNSIAAANELRSIQDDIAIEQRRSSLSGSGIGALQAAKTFADSQRAEQTAQAALRVKPGDQNLINAAQAASEQVKLAAAKTKADLQDAFKTAQDAVRNISKGIQDSVLSLQQLQNTSGNGLNRFLPPELVARRQQSIEAQILPLAGQIARQLGVNLTFNGTTEQRNAQVLDLIDSFRKEQRLSQDIATARTDLFKAQNDLTTINQELATINEQLKAELTSNTAATLRLVEKNWLVNVSVPGGSVSGDVVGAVNSRL